MDWILIAFGLMIVLPLLSYGVMKFGTYGFHKGKALAKRDQDQQES